MFYSVEFVFDLINVFSEICFFQEAATLMPQNDEWEDINEAVEEVNKRPSNKTNKKHHIAKRKSHPASIQKRINAMKVLQLKQKIIESKVTYKLFIISISPFFNHICTTVLHGVVWSGSILQC